MRSYEPSINGIWLCVVILLAGCSGGTVVPLAISPDVTSVRLGSTLVFVAKQLEAPVTGAVWAVIGGATNGTIDANGVYSPPQSIPAANVTITCQALGQTAMATIVLLNPTPLISQVAPATVVQLSTPVVVSGDGFVSGSQILVAGVAVPTTFVDTGHVSATMLIPNVSTSSLTLSVANPSPGATSSSSFELPVAIAPLSVSPQSASVRLGSTLALSGMQLGGAVPGGVWSVAGGPASGSITPGGVYTPPSSIPNSATTVTYQALGQTASTTLTILNPTPVISQIAPSKLTELSTAVIVAGSGFVVGSELLVDGAVVPATLLDGGHLSTTLTVSSISVSSLALTVSNPSPGSILSSPTMLPVSVAPLEISPQGGSVRVGSVLNLGAEQQGTAVTGGVWAVSGGPANGSIDQNGVYSPPASIQVPSVTVTYQALSQTATTAITLLNPAPAITQVNPATLTQISTLVTVTGTGFVSGSQVQVGGAAAATNFVDSQHLTATVVAPNVSIRSLTVSVANPGPGPIVSSLLAIPVTISPLTISPPSASVRLGTTLSLSGLQQGASLPGGTWSVDGGSANGSISLNGVYTPPLSIPASEVTVTYQAVGQTATSRLAILNPTPTAIQTSPSDLVQLSSIVTVTGTGFVAGSQMLINGAAIPTNYLDAGHVSGTVVVPSVSSKAVSVSVSNPAPGSTLSNSIALPVSIAPLTILPQGASVRLGTSLALSGLQQGASVTGGTWSVSGGPANGAISGGGIYTPPPTIPASDVTVTYRAVGQTATSTLVILNPTPAITQIRPSSLAELNSAVTITGTGFVSGSQILIGGAAIPTVYLDGSHLSGVIVAPSISVKSLSVSVSNPSPGPTLSNSIVLAVSISPLTISPPGASVRIGASIALSGSQQGVSVTGGTWSVVGGPANGSISQTGVYIPPPSIPTSAVTATYVAEGQTARSLITILNPVPSISQVTPVALTELSMPIMLTGSGLVNDSRILVGGLPIATTFIDSAHLSGLVSVPNISVSSLTLTVSNPNPGALLSSPAVLPVSIAPLQVSPQGGSVRLGNVLALSVEQGRATVSGAVWAVAGGPGNGSIGPDGVYSPPPSLPSAQVTITCQALGQKATSTIAILNPIPVVNAVTPATVVGLSTPITVTGGSFTKGSQLMIGGIAAPTTFIDSSHLTSTLMVLSNSITSVALTVTNPAPGMASSNVFTVPVAVPPLGVSPLSLSGGNIAVTASIPGAPAGSILTLDGAPLSTVSSGPVSISAVGYLPFWRSGSVTIAVAPPGGGTAYAQVDVPITPTAVSYDVASRFAMQAGFGPRHDIIEHIQQIGLSSFLDEQLQTPLDSYTDQGDPPHLFEQYAVNNDTQLRLRTAWAFQTFMPGQGIFLQESTLPWEQTLEADGFGNFRKILLDVASDPNVTTLLNLPGNLASSDPEVHPNQNFARELLQLFSVGTVMLNDDGTIETDASGNPIPAYGQDTIIDISRALTGWTYAQPVNPRFTFYGIDYSEALVPTESGHDKGAKTIFGSIKLAAGQTAEGDRDQVLNAVFQHQNVPAFISRRLIQRFVKSNPSPAYVGRISAIFKDDGQGVRGDLAAVIKAILLDTEARAGDSAPADDDGFIQDPLSAEIFAMQLMNIGSTDDVAAYYPGHLGEPFWFAPTVFAYYSPDYVIPGTTINSPESQLLTTTLMVQRSQFLWGMINGPQNGFEPWGATWLSQNFSTVPALVDALNHIAYHGTMPSYEQTIITDYCSGLADQQSQLSCTLLLALTGSSYTVVQ